MSKFCTRLVIVAVLLAGCGAGASAGDPASQTTSPPSTPADESVESTTSTTGSPPTMSTTTSLTTTPSAAPTELPLLPTTSTTFLDRSFDPPTPVAPPGPPGGRNSVFVVGDSVFLGTARTIPIAMPDWLVTYDAVGNRRLSQAVDLFVLRRPEIGEAVVIHLGNNYIEGERGSYASQINEVMGVLWFVPRVVWVTIAEVNPLRAEINFTIREAATRWPNMRVADWAPVVAANPQWSSDGIHLDHAGREALARLVAETVGPVGQR